MALQRAALDGEALAARLLLPGGRVLLAGPPGVGKSTLARSLGAACAAAGHPCACLGADPGSPGFGVPGALALGAWSGTSWHTTGLAALCTLDAARFRLPLVAALGELAARAPPGPLVVDAPGVVRGVAGAELLAALVRATGARSLICLARDPDKPCLEAEIAALGLPALVVPAAGAAARPGRRRRGRARTALWDAHLAGGWEQQLDLARHPVTGTPPPAAAEAAWAGRQVALLGSRGDTRALGEILARDGTRLRVRLAPAPGAGAETDSDPRSADGGALLVRDARRLDDGLLGTDPGAEDRRAWAPPPDPAPGRPAPLPRPQVQVGPATGVLVNGVFGDPLLHLRLRQRRRSLLFDLGEARLPARLAHQISDVLVTHAHFDHVGGFPWLLRSRIGVAGPCRLYGPPGLAEHLQSFVDGVHWDRIGDHGPRFEVTELHGEDLRRYHIQAGLAGPTPAPGRPAPDGLLREEDELSIRAVTLDHGIPVLAFALEFPRTLHVRKERLAARGLSPGPWLSVLKGHLAADAHDAHVELPDGSTRAAGALGQELVLTAAGEKLVYATDLGDTPGNRARLIALAAGARVLLCEAAFLAEDADRAESTGHLTTRACAEIADAAGVRRLVPFHFSRRYEHAPARVYAELTRLTSRVGAPPRVPG